MADRIDETETLREFIRTIEPSGIARRLLRKIVSKGSSLKISKRSDSIAAYVPETGEIPVRVRAPDEKILVIPYKIAERSFLSNETIEDAGIDLLKEEIIDLNIAIEKKEDKDFINCLLIAATTTIIFDPYSATPLDSPDDFGSDVDPFDRDLLHCTIRERPIFDDIMKAMKSIEQNGGTPDYLIINPREAEDLRRRDELKQSLKTFGMNVIITNLIDEHFAIVFDSNNSALFVERRPPTVGFTNDYDTDNLEITITERISPVCYNGDMIVRIQRA